MTLSPSTLSDRAELDDLVTRLGRWLDEGATSDPAALFTDDVRVSSPGGEAVGIAPLVAQAKRNHEIPTQHVITDRLHEIDGDAAEMTANLVMTLVDGPEAHRRRGSTYAFAAARTTAGWRLTSVAVRLVWRDA